MSSIGWEVTLPRAVGTTLQQYRGMPIQLTGNPSGEGALDVITGYDTLSMAIIAQQGRRRVPPQDGSHPLSEAV